MFVFGFEEQITLDGVKSCMCKSLCLAVLYISSFCLLCSLYDTKGKSSIDLVMYDQQLYMKQELLLQLFSLVHRDFDLSSFQEEMKKLICLHSSGDAKQN